mmetsp:Transcript_3568/g.10140  ORF Transcript_3568/g.10140 Transcript_3568/m.10140 type:complete len:237 (+) Transcript_3568:1129-1839(+)
MGRSDVMDRAYLPCTGKCNITRINFCSGCTCEDVVASPVAWDPASLSKSRPPTSTYPGSVPSGTAEVAEGPLRTFQRLMWCPTTSMTLARTGHRMSNTDLVVWTISYSSARDVDTTPSPMVCTAAWLATTSGSFCTSTAAATAASSASPPRSSSSSARLAVHCTLTVFVCPNRQVTRVEAAVRGGFGGNASRNVDRACSTLMSRSASCTVQDSEVRNTSGSNLSLKPLLRSFSKGA